MTFIGSVSISNISGSAIVHFGNAINISSSTASSSTPDSSSGNPRSLSVTYDLPRQSKSNSTRSRGTNRKKSIRMKSTIY